ncbi:MAG: response regulator transcription factor [Bacillota bacterium]
MTEGGDQILVIEDDRSIQELLRLYLERDGFAVKLASDGDEGLDSVYETPPALVILDIMLPGIDGWEVCRRIRDKHDMPIIMLTARDAVSDRINGLELGADDYVTKPFDPRELVARVRAVLRRSRGQVETHLEFGDFSINYDRRRVVRNGSEVYLTAKEFDLLWLLANHPGRVFTRDQLLDQVWGYEFYGNVRTVDVHIRHLRQKIEPDSGNPQYIVTVWGVGYKFEAPEAPR